MAPAAGTIFFVSTTIGFLAPVLTVLAAEFRVSLAEAGQLVVVTAVAWAAAALFMGLVSDRFGRRRVLVVCLLGMAASTLAGSLVTDFRLLLLLRLLTGICGSGAPPAILGGITDLYPLHQRGRAIGIAQSGFNFATLLGVPAVGAIGGWLGWRSSFVVVGCALLAASLLVRLTFPAGRRRGQGAGNPLQAYRHLFGLPRLPTLLVSNVFERITYMAMNLYFASFLIQTYSLTALSVAPALAIVAVGTIIGTLVGGIAADRYNRPKVVALGLAVSGLFGGLTFLWPAHLAVSVLGGVGFGLTNAVSRPGHFSLILGLSDRHRGGMAGLIAFTNQSGWALGAAIGGVIINWAGFTGLGALIVALVIAACGLLATLWASGSSEGSASAPSQGRPARLQ
ncbi:MAG TPA: MFS transporter [Dehalococcoidia bacterium]|nr:MFS transporter [Dehalococcoidia bacterium]